MAAVPTWRSSAAELLRVIQGLRAVVSGSLLCRGPRLLCVRLLYGSGWGPGAGSEHRRVEAQSQRGRPAAHAAAAAAAATSSTAATATAFAATTAAATCTETTADASDGIAATCVTVAANVTAAQRRAADSAADSAARHMGHVVDAMRAQHTDEARAVKRRLRFQPSGAQDGAALRRGQMPHVDRLRSIVRLGRVDHVQ